MEECRCEEARTGGLFLEVVASGIVTSENAVAWRSEESLPASSPKLPPPGISTLFTSPSLSLSLLIGRIRQVVVFEALLSLSQVLFCSDMSRSGRRLSHFDCNRIRAYLEETELPCATIGHEIGVNKRTIERMRTNLELFGSFYPPQFNRRGRPRALTIAEEEWLLRYLEDQPTANMDELALAL